MARPATYGPRIRSLTWALRLMSHDLWPWVDPRNFLGTDCNTHVHPATVGARIISLPLALRRMPQIVRGGAAKYFCLLPQEQTSSAPPLQQIVSNINKWIKIGK